MSEKQLDMLGGKPTAGRRTPKIRRNARPAVVPQGHADKPGSGPEGETCGSCTYITDYRYRKIYHKCGARSGDPWKGGRATDIRPLDPACSKHVRRIVGGPPLPTPHQFKAVYGGGMGGGKTYLDGWRQIDLREACRVAIAGGPPGGAMSDADPVGTAFGLKIYRSASVDLGSLRAFYEGRPVGGVDLAGGPDKTVIAVKDADGVRPIDLREACLIALAEPMTADEVAQALGYPVTSIRPRMTELAKAGAIESTGERRATAGGRATAAVYRAKGGKA